MVEKTEQEEIKAALVDLIKGMGELLHNLSVLAVELAELSRRKRGAS